MFFLQSYISASILFRSAFCVLQRKGLYNNKPVPDFQVQSKRNFRFLKMKQHFTVLVEGNIASGKSGLLKYFRKYPALVEVKEEPTAKWRDLQGYNILAQMYEDPIRWGLTFQSYVQLSMLQIHTAPQVTPVRLLERSIFSGRYCFIENLHNNKTMPDLDYILLTEWFDFATKTMDLNVDLIVYLQTKPEVLQERILARQRPEEQSISQTYLQDLHNLHENWLIAKTPCQPPAPVLVLDANQPLVKMYEKFEEEKHRILCGVTATT